MTENMRQRRLAKYIDTAIASNFRVRRYLAGMDKDTLAGVLQVNPVWLTEYDEGRIGASHGVVRSIAKALNIPMSEVEEWSVVAEQLFIEKIEGEKALLMPPLKSGNSVIPPTRVLESSEGDIRA